MELTFEAFLSDGRWVGNVSYVLLIISMAMRDIFWLRLLAIFSGLAGASYDHLWLHDPVGTFWELCFTAVNVVQWLWLLYERRLRGLTPEEARLKREVFPLLSIGDFRKLLNSSERMTFLLGDQLLGEGSEVPYVFLILEGQARVEIESQPISLCEPGDFVGEIGFLNALPASASVIATGTMECLVFDSKLVRRLMSRNPEFERGFSVALNANLAAKLLRRNAVGATA